MLNNRSSIVETFGIDGRKLVTCSVPDSNLSASALIQRIKFYHVNKIEENLDKKGFHLFQLCRFGKTEINPLIFWKEWESAIPDEYGEVVANAFKSTSIYKAGQGAPNDIMVVRHFMNKVECFNAKYERIEMSTNHFLTMYKPNYIS